ncbi:MAG TPA: hypothetical protein VMZ27_03540, partial [Candidatus Saccharimonadales bacterium]|nr:hypothetical protein [Candidatus Saccharimonadales bacterium]
VPVYGPYSGKLNNSGDDVELKKPVTILNQVAYVMMDKVSYKDSSPWPSGADGTGLSLQRKTSSAFGNDPANWTAAPVSPAAGTPSGTQPGIVSQPVSQTLVAYQNGSFSVMATGGPSLSYQWRLNGSPIPNGTNSVLSLPGVQPSQIGNYDVLVFNNSGSVVSSNAFLTLTFPPSILIQPQSVQVRVRPDPTAAPSTNVTFSVTAYSGSPLTYQWRFKGSNILGATQPTLTVTNVQVSNGGDYSVVVSDGSASITSVPAILYPLVTPAIVQPPLSQTVVVGAPVTLSVSVTGNPLPITYEWRKGVIVVASNVVNSLVNFYSFTAPTTVGTVQYRVVIKNLAYTGLATNALVTITTIADSDLDGIPDVWETGYFGNSTIAAPGADPDHDGMSNLQEYIAGTDPTNSLSYLKINASAGPSANVSFAAVSNRTYSVLYSDSLPAGFWQTLAQVPARSTNHVEVIPDPGFSTNRFYRLVTPGQ